VSAGFLDFADVFGERRKIGRENRRGQPDAHWETSRRMMSLLEMR
jgi:hypothetical protein